MHFGSLYSNNMDPDPDQTAPTGAAWLGFIVPMYFGSLYLNNMDPDPDQTAPTAWLGFTHESFSGVEYEQQTPFIETKPILAG